MQLRLKPSGASLVYSDVEQWATVQFERLSHGVFFNTRTQVDAFRRLLHTIAASLAQRRTRIVIDDSHSLNQLLVNARLQPTYEQSSIDDASTIVDCYDASTDHAAYCVLAN